jgi:hypothetical protein
MTDLAVHLDERALPRGGGTRFRRWGEPFETLCRRWLTFREQRSSGASRQLARQRHTI